MKRSSTAEGVFLNLISSVLNGKAPSPLPEKITADEIWAIGKKQSLTAMTYTALSSISPKPATEHWDEWRKLFYRCCVKSEILQAEYQSVVKTLGQNNIKIIPLKGIVLQNLYPSPFMRSMSDIDLLYEGTTPDQLAGLMESIGYTTMGLNSGCHDSFVKKPFTHIEMHRKLFTDEFTYQSILSNLFESAVPEDDTPGLLHMKPEDLYIHAIAHAAKHLIHGGLSVRTLCDIELLNREYGETWNTSYITEQLQSVDLNTFEEKLRETAHIFLDETDSELPDLETGLVFGKMQKTSNTQTAWRYMTSKKQSKVGYIFSVVFPPYKDMKERYPWLKKAPILLPIAWARHWCTVIRHRSWKIRTLFSVFKVSKNELSNTEQIMHEFGLSGKNM